MKMENAIEYTSDKDSQGCCAAAQRKKRLIGAALLLAYSVLTLIGALNHELWFDESQAWGIARDCTIENFADILKHEGHPALWHLILIPFAKLGAPLRIINIISWFFSVLAAGFFMYKAPFGLVMKSAVLFSSGFLFFNSVNSRVYCLIPLLLFLIAAVYPKREKYAPLYGLLVGLLANTHIMMCGLVGILGIFMLAELIKANGLKEAWGRIIGLAIAGVLVVCMILPLVGSLFANGGLQGREYTLSKALRGIVSIFVNTAANLSLDEQWNSLILYFMSNLIGVVILFIFIFGSSYRKTFLFSVVFLAFYTVIVGVIWIIIPYRAICFIYTLVALLWIAKQNIVPHKIEPKYVGGSSAVSKIAALFVKAYNTPEKTISVLLCFVMFYSGISGFYWLIYDYGNDFTLTEKTAEFIMEELPDDAIIVTPAADGIQFDIYTHASNIKYYSLDIQEYVTYNPNKYNNGIIDFEKIRSDLEGVDNLYILLATKLKTTHILFINKEPVFEREINNCSFVYAGYVEIYKVDLEDVLNYAEMMQRALLT